MSKIIKRILNFQKRKNGNISILVLIMSMAIILLTTAMVGYIFHDIGFTELDKGELRALHFAESGLSNMFFKMEQDSKGIEPLPESPYSYTEDVGDPADPEGRFKVEYTIDNSTGLDKYTITSTGVDISSGVTRKVKVETIYINIYDFIFSGRASGAGELSGQINITGPFFVSGIIDDKLLGTSFNKGPLFVKGDIKMSGNASIGEPEGEGYGPIILVQDGDFYFKDEIIDPLNPPGNSKIYLSEYYNTDINITFPAIDESYIDSVVDSGALVIDGDLFIGDGVIMVDGRPPPSEVENYLRFNSSNVLVISGNIVVYGNIDIGKSTGPKYTIEYSGNGNLISTGDIGITIIAKVRPKNMNNFPSTDLMALISQKDILLSGKGGGGYGNPDVAAMLIANNKVETQSTNIFLRGGTVSNNLIVKQGTTIYYETGIGEYLTAGIPGLGEKMIITPSWQEIIPD